MDASRRLLVAVSPADSALLAALVLLAVLLAVAVIVPALIRRRGGLSSPAERATYQTLHAASQAARHLREGLTPGRPDAPPGTFARCSGSPRSLCVMQAAH